MKTPNYYLLADADTREGVLLTVMRQMILGSHDYEDRARALPNDPGASVAFRQTDDGYLWECALPWSMLDGFTPPWARPRSASISLPTMPADRNPPPADWSIPPSRRGATRRHPFFAYTIQQGTETTKGEEERLETADEQAS